MNRIPKPFDQLRPEVAAKILALRGKFSQHRIAAECGVSQPTVSRLFAQQDAALSAPLSKRAMAIDYEPPRRRPVKQPTEKPRIPFPAPVNGIKPYALLMAEAKAEYLAALAREKDARKGGRPPKPGGGKNIVVGKSLNPYRPQIAAQRCDPADALIVALGQYGGGA